MTLPADIARARIAVTVHFKDSVGDELGEKHYLVRAIVTPKALVQKCMSPEVLGSYLIGSAFEGKASQLKTETYVDNHVKGNSRRLLKKDILAELPRDRNSQLHIIFNLSDPFDWSGGDKDDATRTQGGEVTQGHHEGKKRKLNAA